MTTRLGLLKVEFLDHSQTFPASLGIGDSLPPWSCYPLLPILGVDLWGLAITVIETLPRGSTFWSGSSAGDGRMSISR